jgi:hypothetical protein
MDTGGSAREQSLPADTHDNHGDIHKYLFSPQAQVAGVFSLGSHQSREAVSGGFGTV